MRWDNESATTTATALTPSGRAFVAMQLHPTARRWLPHQKKSTHLWIVALAVACVGLVVLALIVLRFKAKDGSEIELRIDTSATQPLAQETVKILVARKDIPIGTLIKVPEDLFEEMEVIKGKEPKEAIKDLTQLENCRVNKMILRGRWVSTDDLIHRSQINLPVVAKGVRALSVTVDADQVSRGFILPNSYVDVVLVRRKGNTDSTPRLLLENIRVFAVGNVEPQPLDRHKAEKVTVTLGVTPEQAEKLSLATTVGSIRLVVHISAESGAKDGTPVRVDPPPTSKSPPKD